MTAPRAEPAAGDFLALLQQRERGKLKLYIGSAAGVGKTFRMLQEAHELRHRGVDAVVGVVETHRRADTEAMIHDIEIVPLRKIEYRGITLTELDCDAIIARHPAVVVVDELAHTNVPGSPRQKRWQDVLFLLDEGINVISAVNVQHLESLNDVIARVLGVTVRETIPDWIIGIADQVVNLDLSAEDLRTRLTEGKIYPSEKIPTALANFFTAENLTTLRELALREVASSVDRQREAIVRREGATARAVRTVDRMLVAMSSAPNKTRALLRKASRIAGRLNSDWYCVYVQTPAESATRIDAALQRRLVDNLQMAQAMGAETVTVKDADVAGAIARFAREHKVTTIVVGQSARPWWARFRRPAVVERLLRNHDGLDVLVVALDDSDEAAP